MAVIDIRCETRSAFVLYMSSGTSTIPLTNDALNQFREEVNLRHGHLVTEGALDFSSCLQLSLGRFYRMTAQERSKICLSFQNEVL